MRASCRWAISALVCISVSSVRAQQPDESSEIERTPLVDAESLPTLPDVIVPGRPNAFPATPLSDETVVTPSRRNASSRNWQLGHGRDA